jgi:fumarate reductase iron-sulfur subunit
MSHGASSHHGGLYWAVDVYRFDPAEFPRGCIVSYRVPRIEDRHLLDALVYIQRHHDRSLAFRYVCRLGMCGTCTVMVNEVPRWACRTSIERLRRG